LTFDVVLAGGGLASGLVALALRRRHPTLRLALVESSTQLGGNHTWSFHDTDLAPAGAGLLAPLVTSRWPGVRVAFPGQRRTLTTSYASIRSPDLDLAVREALRVPGSQLFLGTPARAVAPGHVLVDGARLEAPLVVDARGPGAPPSEAVAFQKFLGREVELEGDWPHAEPTVMDASVSQLDGLRFLYVLPFARRRILVEETFYADGATLDREAARRRIGEYLAGQGVRMTRVIREEEGALPLPLAPLRVPPLGSPLRLGYQGGWLHPTTGFSLPVAAAVATTLAAAGPGGAVAALGGLYRRLSPAVRFCVRLNRLLFRAVPAEQRWAVLARFYRLPRATIERFYALAPTAADRLRILCGRPPSGVSLGAAYAAVQGV
jgi:lycopene beta-cyclase